MFGNLTLQGPLVVQSGHLPRDHHHCWYWSAPGRVGVPSFHFEEGENLITSISFSAISLGHYRGLVASPVGLGAPFFVGQPVLFLLLGAVAG